MTEPTTKPLANAKAATPKVTPAEFMRQVNAERRKVVWPTARETYITAMFVGLLMIILAVFFLGIDTIFGKLVQFLLSLAS